MTPLSVHELSLFAQELAQAAATETLPRFRTAQSIENKLQAGFDPVTVADKNAEEIMRKLILERYPEHGILGEELGMTAGSGSLTWVLDPIDGTRAFITGLPLWGTLIGLNDGLKPFIGVVSQPYLEELYLGTPHGAWLGGRPIRTRPCARIEDAILMSTSLELFTLPNRRAEFDKISKEARMTRFGGDCYAYCMLAIGLVDVVIEDSLKPYDVQALIPIVEGAGGKMTAWDGSSAQHGGAIVAVGDPRLHESLVQRLSAAL